MKDGRPDAAALEALAFAQQIEFTFAKAPKGSKGSKMKRPAPAPAPAPDSDLLALAEARLGAGPADPYPAAHAAVRSTPCPDCGGRLHVCHEGETARCEDCGEEFDVLKLNDGVEL